MSTKCTSIYTIFWEFMDKDICTAAKPCIGLKTLELVQYIVMYFMYSVKNPRIGEVHDHVLLALVHLVD
jgi:hypothetical protein